MRYFKQTDGRLDEYFGPQMGAAWYAAEGWLPYPGTLGADWLRLYLAGPLWRFVLRPGVLSEDAVAGVMMPSVDAVNRHFPLTVVAVVPPAAATAGVLAAPAPANNGA